MNRWIRRLVATAGSAITSLAIYACFAGDTMAPVTPANMNSSASSTSAGGPPPWANAWGLVNCHQNGSTKRPPSSADIGPSGGVIAAGRNRLVVPPGALTETVHITATDPYPDRAFVSFEPEGLVFKKPASLVLDVDHCDLKAAGQLYIVYIDDAEQIVERIEAQYNKKLRAVAAPINHFSGYAVAW